MPKLNPVSTPTQCFLVSTHQSPFAHYSSRESCYHRRRDHERESPQDDSHAHVIFSHLNDGNPEFLPASPDLRPPVFPFKQIDFDSSPIVGLTLSSPPTGRQSRGSDLGGPAAHLCVRPVQHTSTRSKRRAESQSGR